MTPPSRRHVTVLVASGHEETRRHITSLLVKAGYDTVETRTATDTIDLIRREPSGVMVLDVGLSDPRSGRVAVEVGDLRVDRATRIATVGDVRIDLCRLEFDLLAFLADNPFRVFSRDELLRHVWSSSDQWQGPATVTEHIRRIRNKIEPDPGSPRWIVTVRGVGYRFETPPCGT